MNAPRNISGGDSWLGANFYEIDVGVLDTH